MAVSDPTQHGVPPDVVYIIEGLYNSACGCINWKGKTSTMFDTPVGVCQCCPVSPTPFNLCTEAMMRE